MWQYDNKFVHFGFSLTTNIGRLIVNPRTDMLPVDTVRNITPKNFPGIGLGAITNFRLGHYWDFRIMAPVISFVQRNLVYDFENSKREVKVESAYCDASFLVKYKSERRKNTRLYVISGFRVSYDFASTKNKNRGLENPIVSLVPVTYGWEAGFGLDIYYEYFKFSPELKVCNTFGNAMYRDNLLYTNVIENISPQLVQFSLHFE